MRTYAEPAREVPVVDEADVLVAGGGLAGAVAAVAAARNGATVSLIEASGVLGGTATAGLMTSFNGFRNEKPPCDLQTVRGMGQEVLDRLLEIGGACGRTAHGDWGDLTFGSAPYAVSFDAEALKRVLLDMVREAGVRLRLYTFTVGAMVEDGAVTGLVTESKAGRQAMAAAITVDASGDGDVAARAGAPFMKAETDEERLMSVSLMYRVAGVEPERFEKPWLSIGNMATLWGPGRPGVDGTDPASVTRAHAEAMADLPAHVEKLRAEPGFEDSYLVQSAAHLGVRESRRVLGEYVLTEEDALTGRQFDDVIAISSNPVPAYYGQRRFFDHEGFDVPYRCLVPREVDGLLLAGRCISCEQVPFQSARSMAPLMAISQASGTAAALCATGGVQPRELDVGRLQEVLLSHGAELRLPREGAQSG
ncbi:MAG: FAD-dependent oxidoreductase [Planctomycetota bacterium]|jgi:hypothetical protein